ncbi:hypothetical protein Misp02_22680 [Microtetraspora sp. NBRC 16547]|nr:hypothetical protein Misp02_22680 [Microtetraspora sp. NBRC 16547]
MRVSTIPHYQLAVHVQDAVRISRGRVARGGIPFVGVVVNDGRVLGTGHTRAGAGRHRDGLLTLTDLGYENLSPAIRTPVKKPKNAELTEQKAYNQVIRGVHAVAERANSLLKTTFKALRRVSRGPWRIGAIVAAAHVILRLEHGRYLTEDHNPS